MNRRLIALVATAAIAGAGVVALASGRPLSRAPGWNQRVDELPVASSSAALVRTIGLDRGLHPDFGSGLYQGAPIGIPYTTVGRRQKKVPIRYVEFGDESDRGPFPIPRSAPIEGGSSSDGDRHVIVVDRDRCRLYELYHAVRVKGGRSWRAGSGAMWSLRSNRLRRETWTSADAAGLPILPGLARFEELARGGIDHAIRFTAPRTRRAYIYPARHFASDSNDPALPAMGQRLRLKASFDTAGFGPQARAVLEALKRYGMILADNGSPWFLSGAPSAGWDNDDLRRLRQVKGRNFEVVDTSRLRRPRTAGGTLAGAAARRGRLVVTQRIDGRRRLYDEGSVSFIELRRGGKTVLRRRFRGTRALDHRLRSGLYRLLSHQRPCEATCEVLDPPVDRCSRRLRIRAGHTTRARITVRPGEGCSIGLG